MLHQPTTEKLISMRLQGMVSALEELEGQEAVGDLSFGEKLALLVNRQYTWRQNLASHQRLKRARLRGNACVEDIDYRDKGAGRQSRILPCLPFFWIGNKFATVNGMGSFHSAHFAEPHLACLDMVRLDVGDAVSEDAVLLEVWEHGATVQTSFPIGAGCTVGIIVEQREVAGKVARCEPDQGFGYLVDVDINPSNDWFPTAYVPAWQRPAEDTVEHHGVRFVG